MRHYALSRLIRGYAFEGVSTTSRGCRYGSLCIGHKISSLHLDGAAASCPSYDFDVAKISIFICIFQIIAQKIKIFYLFFYFHIVQLLLQRAVQCVELLDERPRADGACRGGGE